MTEAQATHASSAKGMRAALFVNGKSRRGKETFRAAREYLTDLGIDLAEAESFTNVDRLRESVRRAVDQQVPLVIVGGGDGTFSGVAGSFVGSRSTLGVLPLGTGNAFARDLGIGPEIQRACQTIANGRTVAVDLGCVNGDYFLNVATIGLTTRIALALTDPLKKKFGRFVYIVAVVRALATVRPFHVRLEVDGVISEFETLLLVIGNGRYHAGPFILSPDASIVSGRLSLYALANTRKSAFFRFALGLVVGHHGDLPDVRSESPIQGKVSTSPTKRVTVDGEISARTPLEFQVVPQALHVIVPPEFEDRAT